MEWKTLLLKIFFVCLVKNVNSNCPEKDPDVTCFTQSEWDKAVSKERSKREKFNKELISNSDVPGVFQHPNDPGFDPLHSHDIDPAVFKMNKEASIVLAALQSIRDAKDYTRSQLEKCLSTSKIKIANCPSIKSSSIKCKDEDSNYYSFDGRCNNKANPTFGVKNTPTARLLKSGYLDGIDYKESTTYKFSARSDSQFANSAKKSGTTSAEKMSIVNEQTTTLGQLFTHDLIKTARVQAQADKAKGGMNCCETGDSKADEIISKNPDCFPIKVDGTDRCYKSDNIKCLNYFQLMRGMSSSCSIEKLATPINTNTPYIDAEPIYNNLTIKHLLENKGKFQLDDIDTMQKLILKYDERNGQIPGTFIYIEQIFELHNIIFDKIQETRTDFKVTKVLDRVRMLVTAVYQKLFVDMAIELLHEDESGKLEKLLEESCYDETIDPQVTLEMNICLRFFHYFIRETLGTYSSKAFPNDDGLKGHEIKSDTVNNFLDHEDQYKENYCGVKHGILDRNWNKGRLGSEMTCKFYSHAETKGGHDMRSMDYQFARISGEPSYTEALREFYGIKSCDDDITKSDFVKHKSKDVENLFSRVKNRVSDIGFTLGVDFEDKDGNILTPTCSKVIFNQFKRSICGDKFFFSNNAKLFSPEGELFLIF
jgi:hypothetical protein